jgi:predicted alpha-1,2-mannosidase
MDLPYHALAKCRPHLGAALVAAVAVLAVCAITAASAAARPRSTGSASRAVSDPVSLVDEFIGTENAGLDYPLTGAPFGMVQESPLVTRRTTTKSQGNGCYADPANELEGFSQSDVNGCRFNYVPVMPTTGAIASTDPTRYGSPFTRADEQIHPDYSRVRVTRYHVGVELTATTRTGWERYTFPRTRQAHLLFNTGAGVTKSSIRIVGNRTVEGWVQDSHRTYFYARVSRPFIGHGTWKGTHHHPGSRSSANPGSNGGWVTFDTKTDDAPVVVKLGLSYTGLAGARRNLAAETGARGFDFEATRKALGDRWNTLLGRIAVSGGTHAEQVAFYTALYHASLDPNVIGDVDGRYMGFDGKVRDANGFTPYSNLSLWDTYRTQNELTEMLEPKVAHDVDLSILAIGRQDGWLPRWFLENQEDNIMTGDPITPYLVEGWSKGLITGGAATEAYREVRRNATQVPPKSSPMNGRAGVGYFDRLGYIPYGLHVTTNARCPKEGANASCCPTKGNDNDCYYGASAPLEYSAADASLALMAKGMGHPKDASTFARLGQSYRNLFDRSIGLFRPRTLDGTWLAPFDRQDGDHAFHEGDPAQYQWLVPQDPAGLISLLGGQAATNRRLDRFFSYRHLLKNPAATVRHSWVSGPYDYYGPATYDPDNEPDLLAPYMYAWTGEPARTATVVHAAETLYTTRPTGLTGNDDMGEMSAWYVMSAIGLYPTMAGSNFYVETTPEFPHASVDIGTWKNRQGGTLRISAAGTSMSNRYVTAERLDGRSTQHDWVRQSSIAHGGTIDYTVGASPTSWATARSDAPPSIDSAKDPEHTLGAEVSPARAMVTPAARAASVQRITLTLMATAPGTAHIHITGTPPSGWTISARSATKAIVSRGLPTETEVPLTISAPAGTPAGTYRLAVTARMAGAASVHRTATISVKPAAGCAIETSTSCAVDLRSAYDHAGAVTPGHPRQGDFDGQGTSYDAGLLPAAGPVTFGGATFQAPDSSAGDRDFVTAHGQTLALPAGNYGKLDLIGAATGGSTGILGEHAVVTYSDGTTASVLLRFTDWGDAHPGAGDSLALRMRHAVTAQGKRTSTPVSLYRTTLALDAGKTVRSISLPSPAVPIWVAPGLGGVDWNHDSKLEIYAMTLQR